MVLGVDLGTTQGKATAVLGGVVGIFSVYLVARHRAKNVKSMSKKKLLTIFSTLEFNMKKAIQEIAEQEKQIKAQHGGRVPEKELKDYCLDQFEKMMGVREAQIYAKFNVSEAQVKAATKKHAADEQLKKSISNLQRLADVFAPTPVPAWLTEDKLIEITSEMMELVTAAMQEKVGQMKEQGITPENDPVQFQRALQMLMGSNIVKTNELIHKKHNVTQDVITQAMSKYQSSAKVQRALQEMTLKQQEVLSELGIASQ